MSAHDGVEAAHLCRQVLVEGEPEVRKAHHRLGAEAAERRHLRPRDGGELVRGGTEEGRALRGGVPDGEAEQAHLHTADLLHHVRHDEPGEARLLEVEVGGQHVGRGEPCALEVSPGAGEEVRQRSGPEDELVVADCHDREVEAGEELELRHRQEGGVLRPEGGIEEQVLLEQVAGVDQDRVRGGGFQGPDDGGGLGDAPERPVEVRVLGAGGLEVRMGVVHVDEGDEGAEGERRAREDEQRRDRSQGGTDRTGHAPPLGARCGRGPRSRFSRSRVGRHGSLGAARRG